MTQRYKSRIKQNHLTLDDRMPEIVYTNSRMAFYPSKFGQKQRNERRKETNKRKDKEGHEPLEMFTAIPGSKQMAHVMSYAKIELCSRSR